jgi:hypothetical protein
MIARGCHVWCARQADNAAACTCSEIRVTSSSSGLEVLRDLVAVIHRTCP